MAKRKNKVSGLTPIGYPFASPTGVLKPDHLKCNGSPFDPLLYPDLAVVYPDHVLPDFRGEFLRGWDDGRGVDADRGLLTGQAATLVESYGLFKASSTGAYGLVTRPATTVGNNAANYMTSDYDSTESLTNTSTSYPNFQATAASGASPGKGFRVRPRNVAVCYIVRAR